MLEDPVDQLLTIANEVVAVNSAFAQVKGPGKGNYVTNEFMRELRQAAAAHFGQDHSEQRVCGEATALAEPVVSWPAQLHKAIASELNISNSLAQRCIDKLIDSGRIRVH